jgi:Tfp pilus assembly protein PilZ
MSPSVPAAQKSAAPKAVARVAIVGLDTATSGLLRDCFKQFSIEPVLLTVESARKSLHNEKFEACVLRLEGEASSLLTLVRTSPSSHRMVVYGIAGNTREALKYSHHGINAFINDPVDRQNALRAIRATHLLVLHELRRYVRIPLVMPLEISSDSGTRRINMHEISGGGMSVETKEFKIGELVEVRLNLPQGPNLILKSKVAWSRPEQGLAGLRFEESEQNRFIVRNWIDEYLDIS